MTEKRRQAVEKLKASGHFARIGRKGGAANVAKYSPEHFARIGRKGGQALVDKQGGEEAAKEYFRQLSRLRGGEQ